MSGVDVVYQRAAGIDISKSDAKVCVRIISGAGKRVALETRVFGSTIAQIRLLRDWLVDQKVESVVMESTSAYWTPFWDGLVDSGFELVLANAHAVKQLKGRKTDVADAAWLAKLASLNMAPASFVPDRVVRDFRLLTRSRQKLVERRSGMVASLEKLLEDTGLKLSNAASKLLTVSGRRILDAICSGQTDPVELAKLSMLRKTTGEDLVEALEGRIREVHVVLIRCLLTQIDAMDEQAGILQTRIEEAAQAFEPQIELLSTIPGVDTTLAHAIIGEIGVDMSVFPSSDRLAAWAGVAPGANQSAAKIKPAKTRKGDKHLKAALSQAARSAANTNNTFLQARFRRVRARRGEAKAYTALARSIIVSIWHMLTRSETYRDHGGDYYTRNATPAQRTRLQANAEAQLTRLGVQYTIHQQPAPPL